MTQSVSNLPFWIKLEFLRNLTELPQTQTMVSSPNYLSVVVMLLHILMDVETQLSCARTFLEKERLIHNDLFKVSKDMARDVQ